MKKTLINSFIFLLIVFSIHSQPVVNEHSIKFKGGNNAVLVGEDGVIKETNDFGETWIEHNSGVTNTLYSNAHSADYGLAVGENGVILRNTGGTSWEQVNSGVTVNLRDVEIVDETHAIICGDNGAVLISTDAGESWQQLNTGINHNLRDIDFYGSMGYIAGDAGTLLRSLDNGRSWSVVDMSFIGANFSCLEVINSDKIYIAGENGSMIYTVNGGLSWLAPVSGLYESNYNDIIFFDDNTGITVGDNGLLLRTTNGGYSWYGISIPAAVLNKDLNSVAFANFTDGITVGDEGKKYKSTDGGISWSELVQSASGDFSSGETLSKLKQNYPNPFNPATNITYRLEMDAFVSLKVYDLLGREVRSLVNSFQKKGEYCVQFVSENLATGTYFYVLKTESNNKTDMKVMKMAFLK